MTSRSANERDLRSELDGVRARFEEGELTRTDVAEAEARVLESAADLGEAEKKSHRLRKRLRAMGRSRT